MKRLFALILCFCMFSVTVNATSVQLTMGETTVKSYDLDRRSIETETVEAAPFTIDDRTMVPVRAIAEAFDAQVDWDDATQTATITKGETVIHLVLGSKEATVNGETVILDVAATEKEWRTFVPLRFIGEALGYTVKWIPSTERILITDVPAILKSNRSILTCEDIMLLMSIMETDLESILSYLSVVLPAYDYFFYENNSIFGDKFEIFKESISTSEIELLYEFLSNLYISEACADGAIELLVVATLLQEADSFPEEAHNKMMLSIEQNSPDFTEDVETAIEQLAEFAKKIESLVVELEESGVDISL